MPSYACQHKTCSEYTTRPGGYCPFHERQPKAGMSKADAKQFYNSAAWQRARSIKLANAPWCEECRRASAVHIHHKIPLRDCTLAERLDQTNLQSVCLPCHNILDNRRRY